ncbi:MAG: hypothetical protein CMI63_18130 [Parvularcula sp.]|nr:hypothetical protein [Parvularcula sp.]
MGNRGEDRENKYLDFLSRYIPSSCNIHSGGSIFDADGNASKQIDGIITAGDSPIYDLRNTRGNEIAHASIEGCLAAISCKSTLAKTDLYDALDNLASIPPTPPATDRMISGLNLLYYQHWPLKIVFAQKAGSSLETIYENVKLFYQENPSIPAERRVEIIHILGENLIMKRVTMSGLVDFSGTPVEPGEYGLIRRPSDALSLLLTLSHIQNHVKWAKFIAFDYDRHLNNMLIEDEYENFGIEMPDDLRRALIETAKKRIKERSAENGTRPSEDSTKGSNTDGSA